MQDYKNTETMTNGVQETDDFLEALRNPVHNRQIAQSEKMPYPIGAIKEAPYMSLSYLKLKRCGVPVRAYQGQYVLFDVTKAGELLTQLGAVHDGQVRFEDISRIQEVSLDNGVEAHIIAQKLQKEGVPVKLITNIDEGKKVYSLNYYGIDQNSTQVYRVVSDVKLSEFKYEDKQKAFAKRAGIEGDMDYFVFDTPEEANQLKLTMRQAGIDYAANGPTIVCYDKDQAKSFLNELGVEYKEKDKTPWKNLKHHLCDYDINPAMKAEFRAEAERSTNALNSLGVKAVQKDTSVLYIDSPKADEFFANRQEELKAVLEYENKIRRERKNNPVNQDFADDLLTKYTLGNLEEPDVELTNEKIGFGEKIKNVFHQTEQKTLQVKDSVVGGFQWVSDTVNTAKQGVVNKISAVKGGQQVISASKFMGRVAKVGGAASVGLGAAFDPKGTKEFIDDVTNLRVGKIVSETVEGSIQLVMHPKETGQALYEMSKNAVQEQYQGAETLNDYVLKTGEATIDGAINIADTLTHLGSKAFEGRNIVQNKVADVSNWTMEKLGLDTRMVKDTMTYEAYKKDPLAYVSRMFNPVTQSASTGLRSDDTLYTVTARGDVGAMKALMDKGVDVTDDIHGYYEDLNHNTHYTPYKSVAGMAISHGHMELVGMLYQEGKCDMNSINTLSKDTTFMTVLKQISPTDDMPEYYTGEGGLRSYTEKEKNNARIGQALLDEVLKSDQVDLSQENGEGKNAFLVAAETGNVAVVDALIKKGVDMNKVAKDGSNALHLCSHNTLMTKELIQRGVDLNQKNKFGQTPLMTALENQKNDESVKELLAASDQEGIKLVMQSEKHAGLLNKWLDDQPKVRLEIVLSDDHPLKSELSKMSFETDETKEKTSSIAQEETTEVKKASLNEENAPEVSSNISATLAQFSHSVQEQNEMNFPLPDIAKQMG